MHEPTPKSPSMRKLDSCFAVQIAVLNTVHLAGVLMHNPPPPPDHIRRAIEPLTHAITALAVITDRSVRELRDQYRSKLSADLAAQIDANIAGTMEASIWSNSVSCWVDETRPANVSVERLHDVAWPEWDAGECHVRIERESRAPRSGRRAAYDHQIPLFQYAVGDEAPEEWVRVDADKAMNVTGTMLRDGDGVVIGVRFRAIFDNEDLWRLEVTVDDVAALLRSWTDESPWVALAKTPATWAAGYRHLIAKAPTPPATPATPAEYTPGPNAENPPPPEGDGANESDVEEGYEADGDELGNAAG